LAFFSGLCFFGPFFLLTPIVRIIQAAHLLVFFFFFFQTPQKPVISATDRWQYRLIAVRAPTGSDSRFTVGSADMFP
jgi:hypothetical protein